MTLPTSVLGCTVVHNTWGKTASREPPTAVMGDATLTEIGGTYFYLPALGLLMTSSSYTPLPTSKVANYKDIV